MRRWAVAGLIVACLGGLTLACFGRALLLGEQFSYRDAAHFYYPLYQRVETEWRAGHWPPLWEPEENGGMPLLGNPTAAVLYPGKLIYTALPYPLAARLYVVAHTLLAAAAMLALLRHWRVSWIGSTLGAMAYAFGGPVLFQYCNVIYLVGAAWVPLGIRAVDRWLRLGRRLAIVELAIVMAMETLGGDPESAYLTGLAAGGLALALAWSRRTEQSRGPAHAKLGQGPAYESTTTPGISRGRRQAWLVAPALALLLAVWVGLTLAAARYTPTFRPPPLSRQQPMALPWMRWVGPAVVTAWGTAGLVFLVRGLRRRDGRSRSLLVPMLGGLALSAALAGAVCAAQVLPVMEFTGQSARAADEGPHDIYPFSLAPLRLTECIWPNVFGTPFQGNTSWSVGLPPEKRDVKVWVPTLYLGVVPLVLALAAVRRPNGQPWRGWMIAVAVVSLLGALGEFAGPLFWARYLPEVSKVVGPHDPRDTMPVRLDGHLRDGDGSVYWLMATLLPGFRQFRFPSKLLTFSVLAVAALAGLGWDDLASDDRRARRRVIVWGTLLCLVSVASFGAVLARRPEWLAWFGSARFSGSAFGPLDAHGAYRDLLSGLVQGAIVMAAVVVLAARGRARPGLAGAAVLILTALDLGTANARYVVTAPQALFDTTPEVLSIIQSEEARHPSPTPFRVYRVPIWNPVSWVERASDERVRDFLVWERATIQPKYGINDGVAFTLTVGVAELFDYQFYFGGFKWRIDEQHAQKLRLGPDRRLVYYPRRAFDMWNTRYFVLPYVPDWTDEQRGIVSFLERTERVYPLPNAFTGPDGREREEAWAREHDYQVRRNLDEYPRAWIVHSGRFLPPIAGLGRADRKAPMEEILYADDPIWTDPTRTAYDPRQVAWLESDDRVELAPYVLGAKGTAAESVSVVSHGSERVELDARLDTPGLVVLADVFYPGWTLTIDGQPAPVYRVNRLMRGAAVEAGRHRLVFTFRPRSVRFGLAVSAVGLAVLVLFAAWAFVFPVASGVIGRGPGGPSNSEAGPPSSEDPRDESD